MTVYCDTDLQWLAGIIDAEGYIGWAKGTPVLAISTTDRDVIDRAAGILSANVKALGKRKAWYKDQYSVRVFGERFRSIVLPVSSYLSNYNRGRVQSVVKEELPVIKYTTFPYVLGVMEGEASFSARTTRNTNYPIVSMHMSNLECVDRVYQHFLLGRLLKRVDNRKDSYKDMYCWHVQAKEEVISVLTVLDGEMSDRRNTKIKELLWQFM